MTLFSRAFFLENLGQAEQAIERRTQLMRKRRKQSIRSSLQMPRSWYLYLGIRTKIERLLFWPPKNNY